MSGKRRTRSTVILVAGAAAATTAAIAAYVTNRALLAEIRELTTTLHYLSGRVGADYWRVYAHVQRDLLLDPEDKPR